VVRKFAEMPELPGLQVDKRSSIMLEVDGGIGLTKRLLIFSVFSFSLVESSVGW
jgi:hypothetical protein